MSDKLVSIEPLRFPLEPWALEGAAASAEAIQPIPGTWTLAPESLCKQGIKGIICCPNRECKKPALIPYDMGEVDNGALQLQEFQCAGCGMLCHPRLVDWDTRKLFCVAYELTRADNTTFIRKEYLHAESREQAIAYFCNGTGYQLDHVTKQTWRLVDAGIAIGFFGQRSDKDQIRLAVD
jgi:hypothetical protein